MSRNIGKFLILAIGFVLMVYSASRTLAFLQMTLPDGQKEMAFLALAAFDGGLIAWTIFFMRGAEGGPQRAISLLMIVISLAGVVIGFGADTLIGASSGGLIAKVNPALAFSALLATIGIIAINIAAVVAIHVLSPANLRAMAEEEANDKIEESARKQISQNADSLASEIAPVMGDAWSRNMRARYANKALAIEHAIEDEDNKSVVETAQEFLRSLKAKGEPKELEAAGTATTPTIAPKARATGKNKAA